MGEPNYGKIRMCLRFAMAKIQVMPSQNPKYLQVDIKKHFIRSFLKKT